MNSQSMQIIQMVNKNTFQIYTNSSLHNSYMRKFNAIQFVTNIGKVYGENHSHINMYHTVYDTSIDKMRLLIRNSNLE